MKIPKDKAIQLIDEKISQFQKVLQEATYENRYNESYQLAYSGTETLLGELFTEKEEMKFRKSVTVGTILTIGFIDYDGELRDYKKHIELCISQLKVYRERILNFWEAEEVESMTKPTLIPFVSMSFDESDKDINDYITGILKALAIDFVTGERYSKESIPEKVRRRILDSDIIIVIFVKQKMEDI